MRLSSWRRTDCHSFLADINLWLQFLLSSVELGFLASLQHGLLCCVLPVGGLGHCTGPTSALRPPTPTPTLPLQLYIRTLNGFVLYRDSVTGPRASWIAWNCVFFLSPSSSGSIFPLSPRLAIYDCECSLCYSGSYSYFLYIFHSQ